MLSRLTALLLVLPCAAQGFTHCDVTVLSPGGAEIAEEGSNPVISGTRVYAGFIQDSQSVSVVAASSNGALVGPVQTIFGTHGRAKDLRLAAAGHNVYAIWRHTRRHEIHLMFAANHDHGTPGAWDPVVDLGTISNQMPQISADGHNVHIAFALPDQRTAVISSTNEGRTFHAAVPLDTTAGEIVVSSLGDDVYAAWEVGHDYPRPSVELAVSHDRGKTFSVRNLSDDGTRHAREPILSIERKSGRVSMVWREDVPVQGVYLQSTDHGDTWSAPLPIDQPARQFMVQDDGDFIYASYLKQFKIDRKKDWQLFYTYSQDGGKSFATPINLSGPTGISHIPGDDNRPVPWAQGGKFRLTGILADGAYVWSGSSGKVGTPIYLGEGKLASPEKQAVVWQAPGGVVKFGFCSGGN